MVDDEEERTHEVKKKKSSSVIVEMAGNVEAMGGLADESEQARDISSSIINHHGGGCWFIYIKEEEGILDKGDEYERQNSRPAG